MTNIDDKIKKNLKKNRNMLRINRLPMDVKRWFKTFAKENTCNDYGWALSELVKTYQDHRRVMEQNLILMSVVERITGEYTDKEEIIDKENIINLLNGKKIKKGGKEDGKE